MKKLAICILFAMAVLPVCAFALSPQQEQLLRMAHEIGSEIGYPETIQGILMQESLAGTYNNYNGLIIGDKQLEVGERAYGVMQVRESTARYVLNKDNDLRHQYFADRHIDTVPVEEIIVLLLMNDRFNIQVAAGYFKINYQYSGNWTRAVVAYNAGIGSLKNIKEPSKFPYIKHVRNRIYKTVRPFNERMGLGL